MRLLDKVLTAASSRTWFGVMDYEAAILVEPALAGQLPRSAYPQLGEFLECDVIDLDPSSGKSTAGATMAWLESGAHGALQGDCEFAGWNPDRDTHIQRIEAVRDLIRLGDVYQANIARRVDVSFRGDPIALFLQLWQSNPGDYCAWLDFGDRQVLSLSPELLLKKRSTESGCTLLSRPIKGTTARGQTPAIDRQRAEDLTGSKKNQAELAMIVDLVRNDLGRVCDAGTIRVGTFPQLSPHASVWHLECEVSGTCSTDSPFSDLFRAVFPAGSITGAPKIAAIRAIAELEGTARGAYCGSVVRIEPNGNVDMNVAIRTFTLCDGVLRGHFGGGITWDSDAAAEVMECSHKGAALLGVLGVSAHQLRLQDTGC